MQHQINIVGLVDVIGALSDRTLENNLCLMDSSVWQGDNQGTTSLSTVCAPGQLIQWTITAVDLQTPVVIRNITFLGAGGGAEHEGGESAAESEGLEYKVWSGIVPEYMIPGVEYRYRLELQMYEGRNSILYVDTPSLIRV